MGSGSYEQSWRAIPTQRPGPRDMYPVATFKMLNPYIRQTAKQWPIPGPISRKTSTDKVHAIAHRPRCNPIVSGQGMLRMLCSRGS